MYHTSSNIFIIYSNVAYDHLFAIIYLFGSCFVCTVTDDRDQHLSQMQSTGTGHRNGLCIYTSAQLSFESMIVVAE